MKKTLSPVDVIVLAAGSGTRMGAGINKVFLSVKGIPVIYRTLERFNQSGLIRYIYVVCKDSEQNDLKRLIHQYGELEKIKKIVSGGEERSDSVRNALNVYKKEKNTGGLIMIHDGARPFLSLDLISSLIENAVEEGIVVPVLKVFETTRLKTGNNTKVIDRENLFLIQTPQVFYSKQIDSCYFSDFKENIQFTDDASFFEASGKPVYFVDGEKWNIKLTVKNDIQWAEAILNQFQFLDIKK